MRRRLHRQRHRPTLGVTLPKLRFVGNEPHDVPVLGRSVDPDELVEIDPETYKSREWPEALWQKATAKDKE